MWLFSLTCGDGFLENGRYFRPDLLWVHRRRDAVHNVGVKRIFDVSRKVDLPGLMRGLAVAIFTAAAD